MKKTIYVALLASSLLMGPAFSADSTNAQNNKTEHSQKRIEKHNHFKHGHVFSRCADELGLSDSQQSEIKAIFENLQKEKQEGNSRKSFKALQSLSLSNEYNQADAEVLIDEMLQQRKASMLSFTQAQNNAWNVLTPEQKNNFKEIKDSKCDRRRKD